MNSAERHRIFRPNVTTIKLDSAEAAVVRHCMTASIMQLEHIKIQLSRGVKPRNLILDKGVIRRMMQALAGHLADISLMSTLAIRHEINEARALTRGKPSIFAAIERLPEPESQTYTPDAGINWYKNYSLRIVGVEQAFILEKAKQTILDSINAGLSTENQIKQLEGVFLQFSRGRLENIARTETAKIYNQDRWQIMNSEDEIVGYEWSGILDSRICERCSPRVGMKFPKDKIAGNCPPIHNQDRCILLPIFSWEVDSGDVTLEPIPKSIPPALDGFGSTSMMIPDVSREVRQVIRGI